MASTSLTAAEHKHTADSAENANNSAVYGAIVLLCGFLIWTYADAMRGLWHRWSSDPAYGHGFFVPLFAAYLLWHRRVNFHRAFVGSWWGLCGIVMAFGVKFVSNYWYYTLLEPLSIVPMTLGLCLLVFGWKNLSWYGPSAIYLSFMVPLPGRIADLMSQPLQRVATFASTFLVQVIGIPAVSEGNVIVLTNARIGVIEACNGLHMLILFFAVAAAIAILIDRPFWWRCVLMASAVPVALAANILRITATAVAHEYFSAEAADAFFHGLAAWLMMPLGILLLYLELVFLDHAFPLREAKRPISLGQPTN